MTQIRGDEEDVFSHGFICPKGVALKALHEDPDRIRTPLVRTRPGLRGGLLGRGLRGDRPAPAADPRRARPRRRRRLPRQPERAQPRLPALRAAFAEGARHAQRLLREHGRPDAEAGVVGADVRHRAQHPGPGRRPHRPPADAGREPARLERQPADRARHARAAARHPRARRQGRRRRPAPQRAPPSRPTSTTSSGRAPTRYLLLGLVQRARRGGPGRPRRARRARGRARRRCRSSPRDFPPEARRPRPAASQRRTIRRIARELAGADAPRSTAGSARARRSSARSRAGSSTCSTCSPATSTARAARCSRRPAAGSSQHARRAGQRARACSSARWQTRRARPAGGPSASCRSPCLAEEIDTPGDGQVRALITIAGNPVRQHAERGRLRARARALDFMVSVDIYLNETTRHADVILPGAVAARALALRPRALPARGAQRRELLAAGARARRRAPAEWEHAAAARRASPPGRGRTPTLDALDDLVIATAGRARARGPGLAAAGPRRRRS